VHNDIDDSRMIRSVIIFHFELCARIQRFESVQTASLVFTLLQLAARETDDRGDDAIPACLPETRRPQLRASAIAHNAPQSRTRDIDSLNKTMHARNHA
jgi:hypothetical protein